MPTRFALTALALTLAFAASVARATPRIALDSDHDGLSDSLEQALLERFAPILMIASDDCSQSPALFVPGTTALTVAREDGTIYGQAFPVPQATSRQVELHFYHLWRIDCGGRDGHAFDAEHVSALLTLHPNSDPDDPGSWHASFWYAAAHEDTVCDASQITRAGTLDAQDHGATVWISPGKHASFLAEPLCHGGCGGDRCRQATPLKVPAIVNLGELHAPMHGTAWTSSPRWPLAAKMVRSDFREPALARLERLNTNDIAWVNPGKRPAQGTIAVSGNTADALGHSGHATVGALGQSGHNTDVALSLATFSTGNAVTKSYLGVRHSLAKSTHRVGTLLERGERKISAAQP